MRIILYFFPSELREAETVIKRIRNCYPGMSVKLETNFKAIKGKYLHKYYCDTGSEWRNR